MSRRRLQVKLEPEVLRWARERARLDEEALARKVGVKPDRVFDWEQSGQISLTQADKVAHYTHTPLGYLYLPNPVEDRLPIPDFRTVRDQAVQKPSPDLLETVQMMERRQAWMRDELVEQGSDRMAFVGSVNPNTPPTQTADAIRDTLGLARNWAEAEPNWSEALRSLRNHIETAGVLIVFNGIVGNNTHRKLDPDEFRGFVLIDEYAPLIFVNGADFKAAQLFTLMHELAHVWIGAGGVSNFDALEPPPIEVERYCNAVAAEFLVPASELTHLWPQFQEDQEPFQSIARRFRVSSIVAARRALDLELISRPEFFEFYNEWLDDERRRASRGETGGSFWNNQNVRIGKRFGAAIARAVKEGRLLYRDAYSLTGLKGRAFDEFVGRLSL